MNFKPQWINNPLEDFDNPTQVETDKINSNRVLMDARAKTLPYDLFEKLSHWTKKWVRDAVDNWSHNIKRDSDTI